VEKNTKDIKGEKYKMIITYTNPKSAAIAMEEFPNTEFVKELKNKGVGAILNYFHSKENKVYAAGLKETDEHIIREAFETFGEISEFAVSRKKNGSLAATIAYVHEYAFHDSESTSKVHWPPIKRNQK
jgi:hypothetical protein